MRSFAAVETQVLYEDEDGFRYYRYDGDITLRRNTMSW